MAPAPILRFGHPGLASKASSIAADDGNLHWQADRLCETLLDFQRRHGWGRAISAPQIGIPKRLIAIVVEERMRVLVNPEVTWTSPEVRVIWDDCLSLPEIAVRVERFESISLSFENVDGSSECFEQVPFELAELLQHEMDHLNGTLMTARMVSRSPIVARELRHLYSES